MGVAWLAGSPDHLWAIDRGGEFGSIAKRHASHHATRLMRGKPAESDALPLTVSIVRLTMVAPIRPRSGSRYV